MEPNPNLPAEFLELRASALRIARAVLGQESDAEDAVQKTYLKLLTAAAPFPEDPQARRAYFFSAVRKSSITLLSKRKADPLANGADLNLVKQSARTLHDSWETLEPEMTNLNPEWREALELHYVAGLPYEDIAAVTGVPVGSLRVRAQRGREALRERLRMKGLEPGHRQMVAWAFLLGDAPQAQASQAFSAGLARHLFWTVGVVATVAGGLGMAWALRDTRQAAPTHLPPAGAMQLSWRFMSIPGLPPGSTIHGVWVSPRGVVYATTGRLAANRPEMRIYRYDAGQWNPMLTLADRTAGRIFGDGADDLFAAVGGENLPGEIYRSTDRGEHWFRQALPPGVVGIMDIGGTPGNIHAITDGAILRFDGEKWAWAFAGGTDDLGNPNILAFTGPAEGYFASCWGWGAWNGRDWIFHKQRFDFCDVVRMWGTRDRRGGLHLYIAGQNNFSNGIRVWRFDPARQSFGGKFEFVLREGEGRLAGNASDLWGAGERDVYVVGRIGMEDKVGTGRVYRFDGVAWRRVMDAGELPPAVAVGGSSPSDVWVGLADGRLLHYGDHKADQPPSSP